MERGPDAWHVRPGGEIQAALDLAAVDPALKTVVVHEGVYRPSGFRQALVWLNRAHDGITLEAVGDVTLTASNPDLTGPGLTAAVNHVVYFGDGITQRTVLRGFKITGADNFVTTQESERIEPDTTLEKGLFFYTDGGGIKIFGRSYPVIERVEIFENYASPCAGGISVEHPAPTEEPGPAEQVVIRDSVFRDNSAQVTGSAIDLLPGSTARIENCLFVGNVSNTGVDYVSFFNRVQPYLVVHGSGALSVLPGARATVVRSTFTGNWNGVDDHGGRGSEYVDNIFWRNEATGGITPGERYELAVGKGTRVRGCFVHGEIDDLRGHVPAQDNRLAAPDPRFDARWVPTNAEYADVGYRPPSP
ncbi:MAG: right-handed parallel beta-helix repeat-containing protein [Thermoanaerobaculia bacterium]